MICCSDPPQNTPSQSTRAWPVKMPAIRASSRVMSSRTSSGSSARNSSGLRSVFCIADVLGETGRVVTGTYLSPPGPLVCAGLAARDGADDPERFLAARDLVRQRRVDRLVRPVGFQDEEADHGPADLRPVVADRAAQHGIGRLDGVDDGALGDLALDVDLDFLAGAREVLEMGRQNHADLHSVWTSTDSTAGRSWTIACQVSPESAEA